MKLTITNNGAEPETLVSTSDAQWADVLQVGTPYDLDDDETSVAIIGDKPSVREQITQAIKTAARAARELIEAIIEKREEREKATGGAAAATYDAVVVSIKNEGRNAVRAILGDGTSEQHIAPGAAVSLTAKGYVELRELGTLDESQTDGGTQPALA